MEKIVIGLFIVALLFSGCLNPSQTLPDKILKCENQQNATAKQICYRDAAIEKKNPLYCEHLADEQDSDFEALGANYTFAARDGCYEDYASKTGNFEACYSISEKGSRNISNCLMTTVDSAKDKLLDAEQCNFTRGKSEYEQIKILCLTDVAVNNKDSSICNLIPTNYSWEEDAKNRCQEKTGAS